VRIPTVKSVAGSDLTVVSSFAKNIYREIERDQKQEAISKRDEWQISWAEYRLCNLLLWEGSHIFLRKRGPTNIF